MARVKFNLSGTVEVKVVRSTDNENRNIIKKNDINVEFAYELATLAIFGTQGTTNTQYKTLFSLPQGLVILLLLNGQVVAQIIGSVQQFTDNIANGMETTSFGIMGSDNTPAQYNFNQLQLWTVVNNSLQIMISSATLSQTVSKGVKDIVQVQWTLKAESGVPFYDFAQNALSSCQSTCSNSSSCSSSAGYNTASTPCQSSVLNFLFALITVPQLQKVLSGQNYPMSCIANAYFQLYSSTGQYAKPTGITAVYFYDSCLNLVATWQSNGGVISSQQTKIGIQHVYAVDNIVVNIPNPVAYVMVQIGFSVQSYSNSYILFFAPLAGEVVAGTTNVVGIGIEVPYGSATLKEVKP